MIMRQYKYSCCNNVVTDVNANETHCRFCGRLSPILEELDKEDHVFVTGHSGDSKHESRAWGEFFVLLDEPNVKIKKIIVNPNQRLSLQLHRNRDEWWKIISGQGLMQLGQNEFEVSPYDTVVINKMVVHRVENTGIDDLVFVEVQTGECQESDIIRIEDDYGRR